MKKTKHQIHTLSQKQDLPEPTVIVSGAIGTCLLEETNLV